MVVWLLLVCIVRVARCSEFVGLLGVWGTFGSLGVLFGSLVVVGSGPWCGMPDAFGKTRLVWIVRVARCSDGIVRLLGVVELWEWGSFCWLGVVFVG